MLSVECRESFKFVHLRPRWFQWLPRTSGETVSRRVQFAVAHNHKPLSANYDFVSMFLLQSPLGLSVVEVKLCGRWSTSSDTRHCAVNICQCTSWFVIHAVKALRTSVWLVEMIQSHFYCCTSICLEASCGIFGFSSWLIDSSDDKSPGISGQDEWLCCHMSVMLPFHFSSQIYWRPQRKLELWQKVTWYTSSPRALKPPLSKMIIIIIEEIKSSKINLS